MSAWLIWVIIAVVLLIAEMTTFTFYLLWLGVGAFAGAIVAAFVPDAWLLQIIVSGAVAIILTYTTKPLVKRMHSNREFRDVIDELVGQQGEVVEAIGGKSEMGIVRIGTETWSASADEPIAIGEKVVIVERGTAVVDVKRASI